MPERNPQIEKELGRLVSVLSEFILEISEIRVLNNYSQFCKNNGDYNPEIPIEVFVGTSDESDAFYKKLEDRIKNTSPCGGIKININLGPDRDMIYLKNSSRILYSNKQEQIIT